jgi:hypothetical protein
MSPEPLKILLGSWGMSSIEVVAGFCTGCQRSPRSLGNPLGVLEIGQQRSWECFNANQEDPLFTEGQAPLFARRTAPLQLQRIPLPGWGLRSRYMRT